MFLESSGVILHSPVPELRALVHHDNAGQMIARSLRNKLLWVPLGEKISLGIFFSRNEIYSFCVELTRLTMKVIPRSLEDGFLLAFLQSRTGSLTQSQRISEACRMRERRGGTVTGLQRNVVVCDSRLTFTIIRSKVYFVRD